MPAQHKHLSQNLDTTHNGAKEGIKKLLIAFDRNWPKNKFTSCDRISQHHTIPSTLNLITAPPGLHYTPLQYMIE